MFCRRSRVPLVFSHARSPAWGRNASKLKDFFPFVVRRGLGREEASRLAAELESRAHKQLYWIEPEPFHERRA